MSRTVKPPCPMGKFVVLEGIDGSGTTTQLGLVAQRLRARGHVVHETREPSGGQWGRQIRELLAAPPSSVNRRTLAQLFASDRMDHLRDEIMPALHSGKVVLCDRYVISSLVYQGLDCDPEWVRKINRYARPPDLTIVLELPAELAVERTAARRQETGESVEIYDQIDTQRRLAEAYRDAIKRYRLASVNATASVGVVTELILELCVGIGL